MKNNRLNIFSLIILFVTLLSGCDKASINGDLDGRWQILEISTYNNPENIKDRQLYYNFYLHVCILSYYGGEFTAGNFVYENNRIRLHFPYINSSEGMKLLNRYGIFSNPVTFEILYLSKNKLILQDGEITITLRKF